MSGKKKKEERNCCLFPLEQTPCFSLRRSYADLACVSFLESFCRPLRGCRNGNNGFTGLFEHLLKRWHLHGLVPLPWREKKTRREKKSKSLKYFAVYGLQNASPISSRRTSILLKRSFVSTMRQPSCHVLY